MRKSGNSGSTSPITGSSVSGSLKQVQGLDIRDVVGTAGPKFDGTLDATGVCSKAGPTLRRANRPAEWVDVFTGLVIQSSRSNDNLQLTVEESIPP